MKTTVFWAIMLVCLCGASYGQVASTAAAKNTTQPVEQAEIGTFQLIQVGKLKEAIQTEVLGLIEERRHATEVRYYELSPNTLVMIPSKAEISAPGFKPLSLYKDAETKEDTR